jgi:hypothetical protein
MSAPAHESFPERKAMLERLTQLERTMLGVQGPSRVHAMVAIETLRAQLLGLVRTYVVVNIQDDHYGEGP